MCADIYIWNRTDPAQGEENKRKLKLLLLITALAGKIHI